MAWMERRRRSRKPLTKDDLLGIANYLTYSRIAVVPLVLLFLSFASEFWCWIATTLFTLAQLSDVVDGYYARRYGVISSFGKFLDPLADKLLSMSVLIMLVDLHWIATWVAILLIVRDVTITALRSMAASEGIEIAASDWGKKKTLAQSFALGALMVHYPFFGLRPPAVGEALIGLTLAISIGSGIHYVWAFFHEVLVKQRSTTTGG